MLLRQVTEVDAELEAARSEIRESIKTSSGRGDDFEKNVLRSNLDTLHLEVSNYLEDIRWFSTYVRYACKRNHPRVFTATCVKVSVML